jgi:hypothetical protein
LFNFINQNGEKMKKNIFSVLALAAVVISASCAKNEDPAQPVDYTAPEMQATIQGKLLIIPDTTAPVENRWYSALSDVTIIASVSYASLSGDNNAKGAFSTTAKTNEKGEYSLTIPATASGVDVEFAVNDKEGTQKQFTDISITGDVLGIWSFTIPPQSDVKAGQVVIIPARAGTFTADKRVNDKVQ